MRCGVEHPILSCKIKTHCGILFHGQPVGMGKRHADLAVFSSTAPEQRSGRHGIHTVIHVPQCVCGKTVSDGTLVLRMDIVEDT